MIAPAFAEPLESERRGEWDRAADQYRSLLNDPNPESACRATIGLARCLLETCKRGETDEAERLLNGAELLAQELGNAQIRAELLLQRGRLDDLSARRRAALEKYLDARARLADSGSDLVEVDLVLADAERRRGEFSRALDRLNVYRIEELEANLQGRYLDELGACHLARGEIDTAIEVLERALRLDERGAAEYEGGRSALLLAEAYLSAGKHEKARSLINEALRAYESTGATAGLSDAYALLGAWHEDREDYAAAAHEYQLSLEYDKTSADVGGQVRAKRRLARIYRKKGDTDRANELLDQARAECSLDDDFEKAALYQEEAFLALTGADPRYDDAVSLFEAALEIAQEDGDARTTAVAMRNLARAFNQRGEDDDKDRAEALLLKAKDALEARGDLRALDDLLDDLGEVLLEKDEYDEAAAVLEESYRLDVALGYVSSKARSLLLLGKVATRRGDAEAAKEHFQGALSIYDNSEHEVGKAEAKYCLASWNLNQGKLGEAVQQLKGMLEIANRLDRPFDRSRANRLLATAARLRGELERAAEYLLEARHSLGTIDDRKERALLDLEEGRLALDRGSYREAHTLLLEARRGFTDTRSPVDVASCDRARAMTSAYEGDYAQALELLASARKVLEEHEDIPELDDLYDDLGTVYLMAGQADLAASFVDQSLRVGNRYGYKPGKGRSHLLLAKIALAEGSYGDSEQSLRAALSAYSQVENQTGVAAAEIELGDWYADPNNPSRSDQEAIQAFKRAKRLLQINRDRRGLARCSRKLAGVYAANRWFDRADEALQDADIELAGIDDPRATAPLDLAMAELHIARGEYDAAPQHLRSALKTFTELSQHDRRRETYRLLVTSLQALGKTAEALEYIREAGAEQAAMYSALVKDLHPTVAAAAESPFRAGRYSSAIRDAFGAVEQLFKRRTKELPIPVPEAETVSKHIRAWKTSASSDQLPSFAKPGTLDKFVDLCIGSFELFRNPATHHDVEYTAPDAFAALAVAHLIAVTLENGGAPGTMTSDEASHVASTDLS